MSESRLTAEGYWDAGYQGQSTPVPLDIDQFRQLAERRVVETIESLQLEGKSVLEVGAGNSAILTYLARTHAAASFSGLDYSGAGCEMLARRAQLEGATVTVLHQDLFDPLDALAGRFDVVYSLGVVEHFSSLPSVLAAMRRLMTPGGRMFTLIPNMAGMLGRLTRRYNEAVYQLHNPHDLTSLRQGHADAGLRVISSGYLCSTNFGVLASCFRTPADRGWTTYKWLSRVTKGLWFLEARVGDLPHSSTWSPYLYVISGAGS